MVYAKNTGLDVDTMLKSISTGAAGSAQMNNVASKAAKDDYAPGFFLKHFIKDMGIVCNTDLCCYGFKLCPDSGRNGSDRLSDVERISAAYEQGSRISA